jgi:maleate isomerase
MKRTLIGMLTPSSNTVVEPYTSLLLGDLFPHVTAHFARFRVKEITLDAGASRQFDPEPIVAAAELLADAKVDFIAWNGTSASWLGFDKDEALCREITKRTGIAASSAILGLNELLAIGGVRRLGLVTPYIDEVQERIVENYRAIGIETVAERHSGISDNFSFSDVSEDDIADMCRTVAAAGPDAIAIICTNMRGPLMAPVLERELGIPIFDSVAFTLWKTLRATGADMGPLAKYGRLFSMGA